MTMHSRMRKLRKLSIPTAAGSDPDVIEIDDANQVYGDDLNAPNDPNHLTFDMSDMDCGCVDGRGCVIDEQIHKTRCCRCGELVYP